MSNPSTAPAVPPSLAGELRRSRRLASDIRHITDITSASAQKGA